MEHGVEFRFWSHTFPAIICELEFHHSLLQRGRKSGGWAIWASGITLISVMNMMDLSPCHVLWSKCPMSENSSHKLLYRNWSLKRIHDFSHTPTHPQDRWAFLWGNPGCSWAHPFLSITSSFQEKLNRGLKKGESMGRPGKFAYFYLGPGTLAHADSKKDSFCWGNLCGDSVVGRFGQRSHAFKGSWVSWMKKNGRVSDWLIMS